MFLFFGGFFILPTLNKRMIITLTLFVLCFPVPVFFPGGNIRNRRFRELRRVINERTPLMVITELIMD